MQRVVAPAGQPKDGRYQRYCDFSPVVTAFDIREPSRLRDRRVVERMMNDRSERDARRIALAKTFLQTVDAHGDLTPLITEDLQMTFPKWGTCDGVKDFPRYFADLGSYISQIAHHPESFICMAGDDHVAIEGVSSGELRNGSRWPDKTATGRFCSVFGFRGDRISHVRIHIDPDYCDETADHYPWHRNRATAATPAG